MRNLTVWNPWRINPNFFDWDEEFETFQTSMDVYEKGDNVIIEIEAPGFDKDEIGVSIEAGRVTVSGNSNKSVEKQEKDKKFYRKEISRNSFTRSVDLPVAIDSNKAEAEFKDGILTITIPKSEEAKPKLIDVKVG